MTTALLDGDILAHRAAGNWRADQPWAFGYSTVVSAADVRIWAVTMAQEWAAKAGCDRIVVCLSPRDRRTFRHVLEPTYKSNRRGLERPEHLDAAIDALEQQFECARIPWLEADDVMGILGTSERFGPSVVVTIDKDLRGVPCTLFDPYKDAPPYRPSEFEADRFWLTQTLTGDPVDGYKGCQNVGPKKAALLLDHWVTDMWSGVVKAYEFQRHSMEYAILQARLARILRACDYDAENQAIWLWEPVFPVRWKLEELG